MQFEHEKLKVYKEAIHFVHWIHDLLEEIPKTWAVHKQLDRASASIPLNIAEASGKLTTPARFKHFDLAREAALECAACLDVLSAKNLLTPENNRYGKDMLCSLVSMLLGLIKRKNTDRLDEKE